MNGTALILAAHGSRVDPTISEQLRDYAARIVRLNLFDEVAVAFHRGEPTFASVLDQLEADEVVVVPVMTSDGYYCDVVLPQELPKNRRSPRVHLRQTPPVGAHPNMMSFVERRVRVLLREYNLEPEGVCVGVVGHGTPRHPRSRSTTVRLAEELQGLQLCREVFYAFLEESPSVESIVDRATADAVIVIPFLISGGPHATVDIPSRLGLPTPHGATPPFHGRVGGRLVVCDAAVGTHPEIIDMIVDLAISAPPIRDRKAGDGPPAKIEDRSSRSEDEGTTIAFRSSIFDLRSSSSPGVRGTVFLVGAGPGDPGLITVRGRDLLRIADVVVHDRLIGRELLAEASPEAELVDVGKTPGRHRVPQERINEIIVDRARRGWTVVRLKGGDPFVFGRGFEEWTACREAGVDCVVVPGVSSALAAPAAAGIPVTCRGVAGSVAIVTAENAADVGPAFDATVLARIDTVVVLMGRARLAEITRSLMQAGKDPSTPAACIERATTPRQRVTVATLASIAEAAERDGLCAPIVTVVGEVAAFAAEAAAREGFPLTGKRIVITRPRSASSELERRLCRAGATTIHCPIIKIIYPAANDALDEAVRGIDRYQWVVFSSVHGVVGFFKRLIALGLDARALGVCKVAAVGPATEKKLLRQGIRPDLVPPAYTGDALARALFESSGASPGRMLFPRGDIALRTIPEALRRGGAVVDEVVVYSTVDATPSRATCNLIREGVDAIVFCSPSAVRRFEALGLNAGDATIACIGPTTASAAREMGLEVEVVPDEHTGDGLVAALERYFAEVGAST
jgi:uroporphyrinogen III methyltransferase/synthase